MSACFHTSVKLALFCALIPAKFKGTLILKFELTFEYYVCTITLFPV